MSNGTWKAKHFFVFGFLTNELRVASYELQVTNHYSLHQLRVAFYIQVTSYYLLQELKVNFYIRVTSYHL